MAFFKEERPMKTRQRLALYVRVSTTEQNPDGQEAELKEYAENRGWEVTKIYRDKISGAKKSRPALDELMADAQKRKVDIVLVWKFDRFARSVSHLLSALETFRSVGVEFVSVSEAIDTATAAGKMTFTVLGAVAELERTLIRERIQMGVQHARRRGVRLGRPAIKTLSAFELEMLRRDRTKGKLSLRALASKYAVSVFSAQKAVAGLDLTV
jgi:DNA invertase Pin-like site-specific DNA recombinase